MFPGIRYVELDVFSEYYAYPEACFLLHPQANAHPWNLDQKFNVISCDDAAGVQTFDSAGATLFGVVNNGYQVARGVIAHGAARKDQAALTLVNHLVSVTVAAEIERDPSLAGYIGTLIGRLADQIRHLLHAHSDLQLLELAARCRIAGNLAFPAADALDCLCIFGRLGLHTGCRTRSAPGFLCRLATGQQKSSNDRCNYVRKSICHHGSISGIELMKNCFIYSLMLQGRASYVKELLTYQQLFPTHADY